MRQIKRLIIFDDVDVNIQVEHDLEGEKVVSRISSALPIVSRRVRFMMKSAPLSARK